MSFSADSALEYLQRAHKKNRLAHAYLISGPAGSGKSDVAARLAAALNKTTPEKVLRAQAPRVRAKLWSIKFAVSSVLFNCAPPEIARKLG
jgi:adenylylsulfate kinase-like enzyme